MAEHEPWPIELHLRVQVAADKRSAFESYLREAVPFYEKPGNIRVTLWHDPARPGAYIEKVQYATSFAYIEDQRRVSEDAEMKAYLTRWRALLDGPVAVEVYHHQPVMLDACKPQQTLNTQRLILRPITLDDVEAVTRYCQDRRVAEMTLTIPHPYTSSDAVAWINSLPGPLSKGTMMVWGIVPRATGELIGSIGIAINKQHDKAELGYALGVEHWNKGYVSEAALAVRDHAFTELGLNRLDAHHFVGNEASGRVMQKIGMVYEGTLRNVVRKWGVYRDSVCYAILRSQWEALKA